MSTHEWDRGFEEIRAQVEESTEYYPGSSRAIIRHPNRPTERKRNSLAIDDTWDDNPRVYSINGREMEFFTVGQLARALGRRAGTIRKWETDGVIPIATFQVPGKDTRGRRRLYSRAQVEGILLIAHEEGMFTERRKPFNQTDFKERVQQLFLRTS